MSCQLGESPADPHTGHTLEDVLELHHMQISEFGGAKGIRDFGLLESARSRISVVPSH